jgi:hypothetical protein
MLRGLMIKPNQKKNSGFKNGIFEPLRLIGAHNAINSQKNISFINVFSAKPWNSISKK